MMIRVELHCHTYHSIDSLMLPEQILKTIDQKGIDRIAITDHNSIEGALELASLAPDRIIVGEEVKTTEGELIAYFIKESVPKNLSSMEAIKALRAQKAFISVPHPFDQERSNHWEEEHLEEIVHLIDAIEVFNSRTLTREPNRMAKAFAARHNLLETAGSDAHTTGEIGRTTIMCPKFEDAESMRQAIAQGEIHAKRSRLWVYFSSARAMYKKSKGWEPPPSDSLE